MNELDVLNALRQTANNLALLQDKNATAIRETFLSTMINHGIPETMAHIYLATIIAIETSLLVSSFYEAMQRENYAPPKQP